MKSNWFGYKVTQSALQRESNTEKHLKNVNATLVKHWMRKRDSALEI